MKNLILFLCTLFTFGCATHANYAKVADSWIGLDSDQLVEQMGPPQSSYQMNNGKKVISYTSIKGPNMFSYYSSSCKTDFYIGTDNKIESWQAFGSACTAPPSAIPAKIPQSEAESSKPKKTLLSTWGL